MVASAHRISRGSDFNRTLKSGARVSTRDLVVHLHSAAVNRPLPDDAPTVTTGGPWLGLIVSKSVGNAVIRHRVARRLRAAFQSCLPQIPAQMMIVVRARPSAATVSSVAFADQLTRALRKAETGARQ